MTVPPFTLDLGTILILIISAAWSFAWMYLKDLIKYGDAYVSSQAAEQTRRLEERLSRLEQAHDQLLETNKALLSKLQNIELQLTSLNTRFEIWSTPQRAQEGVSHMRKRTP